MTKPNNAAIWYAADGYDPDGQGMNGRRVAGLSFLKGYLRHADVEQFFCVSLNKRNIDGFFGHVKTFGRGLPAEGLLHVNFRKLRQIGTLFYPGPTLNNEAWRRLHLGQTAYSLCGIAHTTSTNRAMKGIFDLRVGPIEPWDAVICTSTTQRASIKMHFDQIDAYMERRNGVPPPARPMLPVIPLGVHLDEFDTPKKHGAALRKKLNIGPDVRVCMVMCRLSMSEKFDPLPMYQALSMAQKDYGGEMALILCGFFPNDFEEGVFLQAARELMPNVALHVVDGKDQKAKAAAFSASDIFLFPIDNVQETFGIAPLEAMAAGLPVIASDWDGLRDTVTKEVGFRIPTIMAAPNNSAQESYRHLSNLDNYVTYLARISFKTTIDVLQMAKKIALLARDRDLAQKMGQAGRAHVRAHYDWSVIIPQMQELWAEQEKIRHQANIGGEEKYKGFFSPIHPPATALFQSYPTQSGVRNEDQFQLVDADIATAKANFVQCVKLRKFPKYTQEFNTHTDIIEAMAKSAQALTIPMIAQQFSYDSKAIEAALLALMKYNIVRKL